MLCSLARSTNEYQQTIRETWQMLGAGGGGGGGAGGGLKVMD